MTPELIGMKGTFIHMGSMKVPFIPNLHAVQVRRPQPIRNREGGTGGAELGSAP